MTPDRLEAFLERVERGETTSMDAAGDPAGCR